MLQRMAEIQDMILAPVTPEQIGEIWSYNKFEILTSFFFCNHAQDDVTVCLKYWHFAVAYNMI